MVWKGRTCWMAAAVAAALLLGPLASADAASLGSARGGVALWSQLAGWLRAQVGGIVALWGADGPMIDPLGQPHAAAPPAATSGGGGLSVIWGEDGSYIDPLGQPHAAAPVAPQAEDGIDPSGGR